MVFGSKNGLYLNFFLGNKGQENIFYDVLAQKKTLSRLQKQEVQKVQKIDIFPKGSTHRFGPKIAIFTTFFFRQYRPGKKFFYDILARKNVFLDYKKKKFKKSKN